MLSGYCAPHVDNGTFLQPRTVETLFWRRRGLKRREIAERMGVKLKTVDTQLLAAREQLGLDCVAFLRELVRGGELREAWR